MPRPATLLLAWLAIVNLGVFIMVWRDKRRAQAGARRISERTLFIMGALGGIVGLIAGMRQFRHKTRKLSFILVTTLLVALNLGYGWLAWQLWS